VWRVLKERTVIASASPHKMEQKIRNENPTDRRYDTVFVLCFHFQSSGNSNLVPARGESHPKVDGHESRSDRFVSYVSTLGKELVSERKIKKRETKQDCEIKE